MTTETTDTAEPIPRFERFTITYPLTGTEIDAFYFGGATLHEVAVLHPMAVAEAIEDSYCTSQRQGSLNQVQGRLCPPSLPASTGEAE